MKKLILIDANSLIHRTFHALPPLTTPDGRPIQAIYGLATVLMKLVREDKPEYCAALFDRPEPTFRKKQYAEYKAQRAKAPDDLISQIIEAHKLFENFGIKTYEMPGWEADDLIGTLAEKFRGEKDLQVMVLTGDLDTLQLVGDKKVVIRTFRKGLSDTVIYDEDAVRERYGLEPEQLIDYKAIVGDASDNIKGIPGVGPKTAQEMLAKYKTLENIFAHAKDDPKIEKKFAPYAKEAELSKMLVTIDRHAPIKIKNLEELSCVSSQIPVEYFKSLGFGGLLRRIEAAQPKPKPAAVQGGIFDVAPAKEESVVPAELPKNIVIVKGGEVAPEKDSEKVKVGFDLKNILKDAWNKGGDIAGPYHDLSVAFWLVEPGLKSYDADAVSKKFLKRVWQGDANDYRDAYLKSSAKLDELSVRGIFENIEMPLLRVLAEMERKGIMISRAKLDVLKEKIESKVASLTGKIWEMAGENFNVNSPQQMSRVLFETLKIVSAAKTTKTGLRSTRAENLEELRETHPVVPLILEYRDNFKMLSTYVLPLSELRGEDGRLHTDFVQTGAATGRLSSQAPNLQNIPQESIWAKELRSAFEASEGYSLVAFDYSQLELRILAAVSGDQNMQRAFREGKDIHRATASQVLGVAPDNVTPEMRRLAKTLNFGLSYGMGVVAFSKTSGLPRAEAQKFIDAYFRGFPGIRAWQDKIKREVREKGYVETLAGRRRPFPEFGFGGQKFIADAERAAINHPIQGLEADIVKIAMIRVKEYLEKNGMWGVSVHMLLSIHDELLFEMRDDMIQKIAPEIKRIMEISYELAVPLIADVSSGKNWGSMKKFSL